MKRFLGLCAALSLSCGGLSVEDFQLQARAAKACNEGDRCVNAGAVRCLCATPVLFSRAPEIDAAAKTVACGGSAVRCLLMNNPRCVEGQCVADTQ